MRVLFLNRFYPGSFRILAEHFGNIPGNTVLFLSEKGNKEVKMKGVDRKSVV